MQHRRGARRLLCTQAVGAWSFGTVHKFPEVILQPQECRREENWRRFIVPVLDSFFFPLGRIIPNYWVIDFIGVLLSNSIEQPQWSQEGTVYRPLCWRRSCTILSPLMNYNNQGHSNFLIKGLLSISSSHLSANG